MEAPSEPSRRVVIEMTDADVPSRRAPDALAVTQVNWTVREGDFWVIGGLHGSGKSDLLATAAALAKPSRGAYKLFGQEVTPRYDNECLAERLRVALVFGEGGRLLNQLTVWENVALPLHYHQRAGEAEARVAALMEATEISSWGERRPSELSRSWRQRVALARALALKPEVLLLDNPLAGLDPRHVRWWMDFLAQLWAGHALMDGRPMTLIAAADDLRPWRSPGRTFALLQDTRLLLLEDESSLDVDPAPALRELLAAGPREI